MIPVIFINCRKHPFLDDIIAGEKVYETRSRNTLKTLFARPVLLAETGNGAPLARCTAKIDSIITCYSKEAYERYRRFHAVPVGSEFDWVPGAKKKVLYHLTDVKPVHPFRITDGVRHGRVWMEYRGKEEVTF